MRQYLYFCSIKASKLSTCEVLVEGHFLVVDADALLERDGVVVLTRIDRLGDPRVRAVSANNHINLHVEEGQLPSAAATNS